MTNLVECNKESVLDFLKESKYCAYENYEDYNYAEYYFEQCLVYSEIESFVEDMKQFSIEGIFSFLNEVRKRHIGEQYYPESYQGEIDAFDEIEKYLKDIK